MSTDLTPFEFQGARVRVVDVDGEPWFVASDVCALLDLVNPRSSLALLDEDEKGVHSVDTPGGAQVASIVNESGLYSLILRSRKPEARVFKRWVTREVLPQIRKTGAYSREMSRLELIDMARESEVARLRAVAERDTLAHEVAALGPAAQSWNVLAEASGDYSLREAAQILDRDPSIRTGQNRLSKHLKNIGWTDRSGQPYQRHVDAGRLSRRTVPYLNRSTGEEELTTQLRITAKGLADLHREMGGTGPLMTVVAS